MKRIISLTLAFAMLFHVGLVSTNDTMAKENDEKKKEYIVLENDETDFDEITKEAQKDGSIVVSHEKADEEYLYDNNMAVMKLTEQDVQELRENDSIVETNKKVRASSTTLAKKVGKPKFDETPGEYTDNPENFKPYQGKRNSKKNSEVVPWNISCVAGEPHANKYKGKKIKVAVIDSGIDVHDELGTKKWIDFSDKVEGYKPIDNSGHGTSVAGVIGARINGIGMEGIASEADLYSLKILDSENEASVSTVVKAIEWCIDNNIDIINMSFGMNSNSEILKKTIQKAYNHNILMVSAAGNDVSKVQYPAAYKEVLSVGSVNEELQASEFSDNTSVDLVAPGENVQTIGFLGSYIKTSGTSIAAAHVTGVAAAVKSASPRISNTGLADMLKNGSVVLKDGSKLVNYDNSIQLTKNYKGSRKEFNEIKSMVTEEASDEQKYVQGSWAKDKWNQKESSIGTGHYGLINNLPLSYFSIGASDDTDKYHHRWIVADSAYRTDSLPLMQASPKNGENKRDENGEISSSGITMASPYHAKTKYDMVTVINNHSMFLYELARRRLILRSNLDLTATNYDGNTYYGVSIPLRMKRRIIVDLRALHNDLSSHYSSANISMNDVIHKGYMVLGVFLHLVQDIQAHRAKFTMEMLFAEPDGSSFYICDRFAKKASDCCINGKNIEGVLNNNYDKYWKMYSTVKAGKLPMIRLKDYLNNNLTIYCTGAEYKLSHAAAYEDNPYFYSARYDAAIWISKAYIDRIKSDGGSRSSELGTYFADDAVPLVDGEEK